MLLLVLCSAVVGGALATSGPYSGQQILRLHPANASQTLLLQTLARTGAAGFDFWGGAEGDAVDVRVTRAARERLTALGVAYDVSVEDVEEMVLAEEASNIVASYLHRNDKKHFAVGRYARFDDIMDLMNSLALKYPHIVTVEWIGKSYEGRDIRVLKLHAPNKMAKKAIFLNSGFHSREWIAHASNIWMMNEMVTQYKKDARITAMVEKYDWYFLPIANPDGYEFSHTGNRFWRKTRRPAPGQRQCYGADPNRNWDAQFGGEGTSGFACSDIYRGDKAFSEPETLAQSKFLKSIPHLVMYYDIHSFSQLWFVPYGYSKRAPPPSDDAELRRVAYAGARAIHAYKGRSYKVGTPPQILYAASGGAYDWCKQNGVKYAYALELRPQSGGMYGFVVDAREIPDSGRETLQGILAAAEAMKY